ncbi:MAG: hypothetical protein DHS20C02_07580 [Micavibrio sp.]|nr:MAG: hypothetical protein DHS20C02_07580 [Micavibrio sp.]
MLRILLFVVVGLAVLAPAVSKAGEERKPLPESLQKKYDRRAVFMAPYDLNEDKILQTSEINALIAAKFTQADGDGDGKISEEEQQALLGSFAEDNEELYGAATKKNVKKLTNRLHNADDNEDGVITKKEYYNYFGGRYRVMDKNGDGNLTVKEFRTDTERRKKR